ncbi:glucokinase [Ideonella sp.]|uniref:glucokinase n=1 Tax=Ideonella sp. TaxID=1929293 RepID=UPI002B487378|nr:glucokinase [Ideonella sp.]HJV70998.1 glucokinase [Ideonella sp.]
MILNKARPSSYPRLVADIGGTNARFGWIAGPGAGATQVRKLAVPDFPGPADAARAYLSELSVALGQAYQPPRQAAMAVATAVGDDRVAFTNSHWGFSRAALQAALGLDGLQVLNDFEALALALPHLRPEQLRAHGALPQARGTLAVIGPGTGLGVAGVVQTRHGWLALPGEGGHSTLAPGDDFESEVLRAVRRDFSHVSAERLLSGIGLPVLHRAVAGVLGQQIAEPWAAEQIMDRGLAGADEAASRSLDTFCTLLGSFAGNVALVLGARGGVYIGGGIVPRMEQRFFASAFRERFEAKGRLRGYLEAIPTALITDTLVALTGAAAAIEQQVG